MEAAAALQAGQRTRIWVARVDGDVFDPTPEIINEYRVFRVGDEALKGLARGLLFGRSAPLGHWAAVGVVAPGRPTPPAGCGPWSDELPMTCCR